LERVLLNYGLMKEDIKKIQNEKIMIKGFDKLIEEIIQNKRIEEGKILKEKYESLTVQDEKKFYSRLSYIGLLFFVIGLLIFYKSK